MSAPQQRSPAVHPAQTTLAECLIALAGTPDDSRRLKSRFAVIAQLCARPVTPAAGHASVITVGPAGCRTVAASSAIAAALDGAQTAAHAGPGPDSLRRGCPIAVPDVTAAADWPVYRAAAAGVGLRASLSIPLFAGGGAPIAALTLYGYEPDMLAPVTAAVLQAYDPDGGGRDPYVGCGATGLVAGLTGAFAVRGLIRRASAVLAADRHAVPAAGYAALRGRAAGAGVSLVDAAAEVIAEHLERAGRPGAHR